ncbi:MAG: M48 family metallopeptidase [Saprospiraceae bacterium]|nr:M48 family metallopeptidase [Saprospiraceae bacterium]MCB0573565.1 M48 family metallopeptidase [Saprospiraceae bacterium]MCB9354158.1 M48 family metallopeptidase [Lewinellaceae bacterium]
MWKKISFSLFMLLMLLACSKNAFTGRKSLNLIPTSTINSLSFSEYKTFLSQNKTLASGSQVDLVRRVGKDLKAATEVYYRSIGKASELKDFAWEFNVVDDPNTVNAFCMPGGKVVVYTGILKVTQNEDALAVVMGHEIAHALAHHGNERMSQGLVAQLGLTSLDLALSQKPAATRNLLMTAAGAGAQIGVLLPFSRKHESEADEIGLYLMAMAGYNPSEAAPFWQRMNSGGGSRPPEFMSTHPDPAKRSETLRRLVPRARAYAKKYPVPASSKN